jgi:hypothetical protein
MAATVDTFGNAFDCLVDRVQDNVDEENQKTLLQGGANDRLILVAA